MSASAEWTTGLVTGGIGAGIGSVVTALVQVVGRKGISRAEAADRVTSAAGNVTDVAGHLADRLDRLNTDWARENKVMRSKNDQLHDEIIELRQIGRELYVALAAVTELLAEITTCVTDQDMLRRTLNVVDAAKIALRHTFSPRTADRGQLASDLDEQNNP